MNSRCYLSLTLISSLILTACAREPKIDAARLASQNSVRVEGRISPATSVSSNTTPRGQKAGSDATEGAAAGASVWFEDPYGMAIAVAAPVVILATAAAGGLIGGAYGAATGSSATPEEINHAIATLNRNFRPAKVEGKFEVELAKAFRTRLKAATGTCIEARREKGGCRPTTTRGVVNVIASFQLAQSRADGAAGGLDLVSGVTLWADPRGLVEPNCISWTYRTRAGNLIELAKNGGAPMQRRLEQVLPAMAYDLTYLLLPRDGAIPPPPQTASAERRGFAPRQLNKVEYDRMMQTRKGREAIESGLYILDESRSPSAPRKLNKVEYKLAQETKYGRHMIEKGLYVLDEARDPSSPRVLNKAEFKIAQETKYGRHMIEKGLYILDDGTGTASAAQTGSVTSATALHSGKWTRKSCSYAALAGMTRR